MFIPIIKLHKDTEKTQIYKQHNRTWNKVYEKAKHKAVTPIITDKRLTDFDNVLQKFLFLSN